MVQLDENTNGQGVNLRAGDLFEIRLAETRTTGFKWIVAEAGEAVCELVEESAEAPAGPPGRAGMHRWQFRAARPGEAKILLHYRRPWEKDAEPGRVFQVRIRVT